MNIHPRLLRIAVLLFSGIAMAAAVLYNSHFLKRPPAQNTDINYSDTSQSDYYFPSKERFLHAKNQPWFSKTIFSELTEAPRSVLMSSSKSGMAFGPPSALDTIDALDIMELNYGVEHLNKQESKLYDSLLLKIKLRYGTLWYTIRNYQTEGSFKVLKYIQSGGKKLYSLSDEEKEIVNSYLKKQRRLRYSAIDLKDTLEEQLFKKYKLEHAPLRILVMDDTLDAMLYLRNFQLTQPAAQ